MLWKVKHLKNGEFPKIFPFTKFNIKRVRGDLNVDHNTGEPSLITSNSGDGFVDKKGRRVNKSGYLIDIYSNVIDIWGKIIFELIVLDNNGQIPLVFRTNLLGDWSDSSKAQSTFEPYDMNRKETGGTPLES